MSHYARTIHSSFTSSIGHSWASSSSSSPYATSSSSAHANLLLGGYMHKYPPGLSHNSDWRGGPNTPYYSRRRSNTITLRAPTSARRAAPPASPSPRAQPASTTYMKFDPFSDDFSVDVAELPLLLPRLPASGSNPLSSSSGSPVLYRTPRMASTRPASLQQMQMPVTIKLEPAPSPPALDRNARSRLVAGILLNRVHAVGKPMRGGRCREPKEYVKSGLSSVVSLDV